MVYKAVIFDLDGTLVHTKSEYIYDRVRKALQLLGTNTSDELILKFWFESNKNEIIATDFRVEVNQFWETFRPLNRPDDKQNYVSLYPDIDLLSELKHKNYKIGAVTSCQPITAFYYHDLIGRDILDVMICANVLNGIKFKPHPQGLEHCLGLLGVTNREAVYVGNADDDVGVAKNAGVVDVLIDRGEYDFSRLNPTHRITSLYELRKILGMKE